MNDKKKTEGKYENPIDAVLNDHQDGELSRPESVKRVGFDVKADDLAHLPHDSSKEHSLDDTHKTLTPLETDVLDEALENTMEENE